MKNETFKKGGNRNVHIKIRENSVKECNKWRGKRENMKKDDEREMYMKKWVPLKLHRRKFIKNSQCKKKSYQGK